ncbi:MAG: hypothetical protein KDA24_16655 [Deltaproteobacteria bacterium]|nr:hypothetical protein [Deltaproteobacteria bacterium]
MLRRCLPFLVIASSLVSAGCPNDVNIGRLNFGSTAIVLGDFDTVEQLIQEVANETTVEARIDRYDGYIDGPRYESDATVEAGVLALQVEDLLRSDTTEGLQQFKTVFFTDGMRGCNQYQYNGVSEDDHLVLDQTVVGNVEFSARQGMRMYFSDWTYDLMEAAWPDLVDWIGDDEELDDAQRGLQQTVLASIVDEGLAEYMEVPLGTQMEIVYNFGSVAVIDSVDTEQVDVLLTGDVLYDDPVTGEQRLKEDAPLLISASVGTGVVLFTTFHNEAQISDETRDVLAYGLGQLSR